MNNRLYTIQDAANILGVSTKTLRRWDQRGRFVPTRTVGNQRRYTQSQIEEFKIQSANGGSKFKSVPSGSLESAIEPLFTQSTPKETKANISLPSVLSGLPSGSFLRHHFLLKHKSELSGESSQTVSSNQNKTDVSSEKSFEPAGRPPAKLNPVKMGFVVASLVLIVSLGGAVALTKYNVVAGLLETKEKFAKFIANLPRLPSGWSRQATGGQAQISFIPQKDIVGNVLAAETLGSGLILNVNIPSFFSEPVTIGTTASEPSAILNVVSQEKGFLAPRMTTAQVNAITSPAAGLFVYNTDTNHYNMYNGTAWQGVFTAIGDSTTGEAFTEKGTSGTALYFYNSGGRGKLTTANLGGARTYTLPNASGEVSLLGQTISNSELDNSKVTVSPGTNMTGGGDVALGSSVTLTLKDSITLAGTLTVSGATLLNSNVGLGGAITDAITFTGRVAQGSSLIPITATGTNNLGSSSLPWDNIYADNVFAASSGISGYWQRNSQALSPTNITDDLLLGATSTASAKFGFINVGAGSPTATISGNLSLVVPTTAGANTFNLLNNSSLNFRRSIGGDAGVATVMYFQNSGNIGIGNTAPGTVLDVTGAGTFSSNLAVNGGSITTTSTTGNLFNATATTVSLAGAATTLTIGATTGTATIQNATVNFPNATAIGIGNTAPLTALDVTGSASLSANLSLRGSGTAHTFNILQNGFLNFQRSVGGDAGLTTALFFQNDGNVGIGTTAPLGGLDVRSSATISGGLTFTTTPTIQTTGLQNLIIGGTTTGGIGLSPASATPSLFVMNGGNVGIGSVTPTTFKLEIAGIIGPSTGSLYDIGSSAKRFATIYGDTGNFTNIAGTVTGGSTSSTDWLINSSNATNDTSDSTLTFERGTPTTNVQFKWNSTTKQLSTNSPSFAILPDSTIAFSGTSALMVNQIQAQDIFTASASGTTKFVINNSGNVGIQNATPLTALDITGSASLSANLSLRGSGTAHTFNILDNGSLNIQKSIGGDGGVATVLYLQNSGNVGINNTAPAYKFDLATSTASDRGINIANTAATGTNYGVYSSVTGSATANIGGYFVATGATTSRGLEVAALTSATSTGLTIGALSGTTADTGINIGAISGSGATGGGITVGNISTTGTTNYGLSLGTMTGGTTSNYQINTGILTSATTTTNAQLNLGGVVTTGGTTNYGINVGALSGTGTTNYGVNVNTLTSTGTTNYGLNIGGATGAATTNYGILIGAVSGATTNYGLYTTSGTTVLNATSGNVGIGGQTTPLTALDVTGSASLSANLSFRGSGTAHTFNILDNGSLNFRKSIGGDAGVSNVLYLENSGNVGIGITAPTAKLEVSGGINLTGANTIQTTTGDLTIATNGGNGNVGIQPNGTGTIGLLGSAVAATLVNISTRTYTDPTGNVCGVCGNTGNGLRTAATTGAYSFQAAYFNSYVRLSGSNNQNWTNTHGLVGHRSLVGGNGGSGTITGVTNFLVAGEDWGDPALVAGLTISNDYGFYRTNPSALGANTTITNLYGFYVEALTRATNNYGVYINTPSGGTVNEAIHVVGGNSFFGGNVGIGNSSPLVGLDVTGSASLSANLSLRGSGTAHTFNILDNGKLNIQRSIGGDAGLASALYLNNNGSIYINGTSNANMTTGLTINQGTASNSNEIFTLKGTNVAHGMTGQSETDSFFNIFLESTTTGAVKLRGLSGATQAMHIEGMGTTDDTTKNTSSLGYIRLSSYKKSGTGVGNLGANANILAIEQTAGTRFILNAEGDINTYGLIYPGNEAAFQTTNYISGTSTGIGIGTTAPGLKLDVQDSQSATAAAQIYNTNTGTDADGLVIKLGNTSTSTVATTNHFISFESFGIGIVGSVQGNGSTKGVTYATSGIADFAEYFKKDPTQTIEFGSAVCLNESGFAVLCSSLNSKILGIASQAPAFLGGENLGDKSVPVGLVGQVRTRVSTANGEIKIGDPLTTSSIPGVAVKATSVGQILGKAIEPFAGAAGEVGKILVSVNISWYNPSIFVSYDGTLAGMASTVSSIGDQLTSQGRTLASQGDALQAQIASASASLAAKTNYVLANDSLFKDLKDKVSSLESKLDLLSLQFQQQASTSALLAQLQTGTVLGASTSAGLTKSLGNVEIDSATITNNLMVLGRTTVTDLGVTGTLNAGLLAIHGLDGEINTLSGDLYLQKDSLGGINIFNGKIVMNTKGNLTVSGTITANTVEANNYTVLGQQSIGSATIPAGATSIDVTTAIASSSSKIFLTSTSLTDKQITVIEKSDGRFKVAIPQPTTSPISFDWWIVGNK